ncbi:helix-turn-helix domain-containing protein [Dactylosporangium sp. AC04546]|uniref:PucR family transcriptional regulator n=1 Tax=Dactylosporangium sp. AC04546 TaxID=2862460 RepID=UPI001EE0363F|nr:PucR family transcriptional regulator [Dactylosporangium sp. AC04546]WVK89737.1 helix-turn-helix domain-containing protein [Dactylosporangium sp. AC04546]
MLDDLVDEMARLLQAPCVLEDAELQLIAFSGQRDVDVVRQRSILERGATPEIRDWFGGQGIHEATDPVRTPGDDERGILPRVCIPARRFERVHGFFWLPDPDGSIDESLFPEAMRIAESAAALLELAERRQMHRDELYRALVEGWPQTTRRAATEMATAAGLRPDEPVTCVLVDCPGLPEQLVSRPTRAGLVWAREDDRVAAAVTRPGTVHPAMRLDEILTALGLGRRLSVRHAPATVGIGPTVPNFDDLTKARDGAWVALRVARRSGAGTVTSWTDLGPLSLLGLARDRDLRWALFPAQVDQFLASASAELLETTRVFLDEAGSVSRTADRLGIHRQTVYHRLDQMQRQTGFDLGSGDDRLRLHLAIRLAPFLLGRD